jgi:phage/plasmid-associated DNA primase
MDTEFNKKIPLLLEPFAWVLLDHRKNIKIRIEPEKVKAATDMYRKQNDIYRQFIEECIVEIKDASITLSELNSFFKEWFKDIFTHQTPPNKNDVKEYFIKLWDEPEKGMRWKGYRLRTLQDDINAGKAVKLTAEDLNFDTDVDE